MPDLLHAALFPETLTAAQRDDVRRVLTEDAAARRLYRRVQLLQQEIATGAAAATPDRHVLVLDTLVRHGYTAGLAEDEMARLASAEKVLTATRERESTRSVLGAMAADIAAFEKCWADTEETGTRSAGPATRQDRAPRAHAPQPRWAWRIGATLALVAFAVTTFLLVQRDASLTTLDVAAGAAQTLTLADGSTVRLVGPARLIYSDPEAGAVFNRQVTLSGDAFFDVEAGAQSFVVRTEHADVRVLGTVFGVRSGAAATEVTLLEGRVMLAPAGDAARAVTLAPGQQSRVAQGGQVPTPPAAVDMHAALKWTGLLFFDDTPMREVATELAAAFGVSIDLDARLANERITGTFDQEQGVEEILRTLATTLDAHLDRTETGWRVSM